MDFGAGAGAGAGRGAGRLEVLLPRWLTHTAGRSVPSAHLWLRTKGLVSLHGLSRSVVTGLTGKHPKGQAMEDASFCKVWA